MPHPDRSVISEWIDFIGKLVGKLDSKAVMIEHNLGCEAVLHYLKTLGEFANSVGKTVLVASRFPPRMLPEEAGKKTEGDEMLETWLSARVHPKT
jgi:predicted alpha/beta hydrolase family esterase